MCQFVILILKLFKNYRKANQIECQIILSHPRKTINPPPLSLNVTGHAYKQKHKQFNKIYLHRYSVAILISSTRIWEIVSSRLLSTILEELVTVSIRYLNRLIRKKKKKKKNSQTIVIVERWRRIFRSRKNDVSRLVRIWAGFHGT